MSGINIPEDLALYRLFVLEKSLKLETLGMTRSKGPSVFRLIKKEFGFTGNMKSVYEQFKQFVEQKKLERFSQWQQSLSTDR